MIARRLTMLERLTCASPDYLDYLDCFGLPTHVDALNSHRIVGLLLCAKVLSMRRDVFSLSPASPKIAATG
jgi:hypothetical protein